LTPSTAVPRPCAQYTSQRAADCASFQTRGFATALADTKTFHAAVLLKRKDTKKDLALKEQNAKEERGRKTREQQR